VGNSVFISFNFFSKAPATTLAMMGVCLSWINALVTPLAVALAVRFARLQQPSWITLLGRFYKNSGALFGCVNVMRHKSSRYVCMYVCKTCSKSDRQSAGTICFIYYNCGKHFWTWRGVLFISLKNLNHVDFCFIFIFWFVIYRFGFERKLTSGWNVQWQLFIAEPGVKFRAFVLYAREHFISLKILWH